MHEYHGWVHVAESDYVDEFGDRDNEPRAPVMRWLAGRLEAEDGCTMSTMNGVTTVILNGHSNHAQDRIVSIFRELGDVAQGSFGVLLERDDDVTSDWTEHTMVRGVVSARRAEAFSPHVPTLEDD